MKLDQVFGMLCVLVAVFFLTGAAWGQSEVADSAEDICPLLPGAKIPSVELQRLDGERFDLLQEVREQQSILIFYRGGW
jgi:hypothetical protein